MQVFIDIKALLQVRDVELDAPLRGEQLGEVPTIENAWLAIENGRIHSFGAMESCPDLESTDTISLKGSYLMPAWVDSHTHTIFAATREREFVQRIQGMSYQEIAALGGGILNSAVRLREMSETELFDQSLDRLTKLIALGTGAIEIKSGYGLSEDAELKMLHVARRLGDAVEIPVKVTFLGAHALPPEYKHDRTAYMRLLIKKLLPKIATEKLADYVDIFCEKNFFTADEAKEMMAAGKKHGLKAKIHTNQFTSMGGIEAAIEADAVSVDHLEIMTDKEIKLLANSNVIASMLPTAPFFLSDPYPPARKLIDRGAAVALASDYNPGSSPSGNMNFVNSLACIAMRMTPEEAMNAATINGAFALELQDQVGSITVGKRANLIVTKPIPSWHYMAYSFGENNIESVWINGVKS